MRLSNRNKAARYNFLNSVLTIMVGGGVIAFLLERYKFDVLGIEAYLFIIIPVLLLITFYISGKQIFEYDSDGEVLNFKNRNILQLFSAPVNDEFPKYKLASYEIFKLPFYKRLYVVIHSKKKHKTRLSYDITYLTRKEISDLKLSLSKVVRDNQNKTIQIAEHDD